MNIITVFLALVYLHVISGRALYDQIDIEPIITNRNIAFLAARPSSQQGAAVVEGIPLLYIWKPYSPYLFPPHFNQVNSPILKAEPFNKADWLVLRGDCLKIIQGAAGSLILDYLGDCGVTSDLAVLDYFSNISELLTSATRNEKGTLFHDFATDPNSSTVYFMLSGKNELYQNHNGVVTVVARSLPPIRQVEYAFDQKIPYLLAMNSDIYRVTNFRLEAVYNGNGSFEIFDIEYYEDGVWLLQTTFPDAVEDEVWFGFLDLKEPQPRIMPFRRNRHGRPQRTIWKRQQLDMAMVHKLDKVIIPQKNTSPGIFGYYAKLQKYPDLVADMELTENQFLKFNYTGDAIKIRRITMNCIPVCTPKITAVAQTPFRYQIYDREIAGIAESVPGQPLHRTVKLNVIKFSVPDRRPSNVSMTIELTDGVVFTTRAISIAPQATILLVPSSGVKPLLTLEILGPFTLQLKMHLQQFKSSPPTKFRISRIGNQSVDIESEDVNNGRIIRWDLTTNTKDNSYYNFSLNEEPPEVKMEFLDGNGTSQLVRIIRPTINEETSTKKTEKSTATKVETTGRNDYEDELLLNKTTVVIIMASFLFAIMLGVIGVVGYVWCVQSNEMKKKAKIKKTAHKTPTETVFKLAIGEQPPFPPKMNLHTVDQYEHIATKATESSRRGRKSNATEKGKNRETIHRRSQNYSRKKSSDENHEYQTVKPHKSRKSVRTVNNQNKDP